MSSKRKVFIAIPAYDQKIAVLGMVSIFNNMEVLKANGIECQFGFQLGDCYLDRTRNKLCQTFLKSDCTDMIFVDNDLAFEADAMLKLMSKPVQIISGAYPYRSQDKEGFPISVHVHENKEFAGNKELGIIDCKFLPTGLMRIRRDVFDKFKASYPDHVEESGEWQFFRTGLLFQKDGDTRWFGEDVYFCEQVKKMGVICWCDPTIGCTHIGQLNKTGRLSDYLKAGGQVEMELKKFD